MTGGAAACYTRGVDLAMGASVRKMLRNFLFDPAIATIDLDSPDRIARHREILARKRMIREVFFEIYAELDGLDRRYFGATAGKRVEIGAGSSLLKTRFPDVESTDVVASPGLDRVVDAMSMPYADNSVRAIFGIHCFHHLDDPYRFIREINRVCAPGGGIVLVEPYFGPVGAFIHKHLYKTEYFDTTAPAVRPPAGPMSGANQALSYIVFVRDRQIFAERFPELELVHMEPLKNYVRYLASGGITFRQLLPDIAIPLLKSIEGAMSVLSSTLAVHHIMVVRRKG
jgi:SAM-dependent methyltransferase